MKKRVLTAFTALSINAFSGIDVVALSKDYPFEITASAKEDIAEVRISGVIHQWQNSSSEFKKQIDGLLAKGIKNVSLYINTPGGSVFEANEIANEIKRFPGTITGYGGALVASAGSYLAIICDTFEMAENGQYMYHKPIGFIQGNEDKVISDLKLLQNLTNQYRTAYSTKTGLSESDIEANWSKGDVWLSAKEAKEQGFITSISKKQEVSKEIKAMIIACGAPNIPEQINSEHKMKNRNQIIAKLKLSADATDEQIEQAIADAMEKTEQLNAVKGESEKQKKETAELLVQAYVDSKQITADTKDKWVERYVKNPEDTKDILAGLPKPFKASEHLGEDNQQANAGRDKWTLKDYLEKDPKALDALAEKDPEKYMKLNNEYYG